MIITGVADMCADRIASLVYLDAVTPRNGESFLDCAPSWVTFKERINKSPDGFLAASTAGRPFGITSLSDSLWVKQKLVPHPIKTLTDPLVLSNPANSGISRTYIYCNGDKAGREVPRTVQRFIYNAGWSYVEMNTGHDAMITVPNELTSILLALL